MGAYPEVAIFHRFAFLNALNLLYLQAELHMLQRTLEAHAKADDASADENRRKYYRHWLALSESTSTRNGDPAQWNTMQTIKEKLKEYSMDAKQAINDHY